MFNKKAMKINTSAIRILAIDPGFDRLGIAIIDKENQKEEYVFSTCVITNRKDDMPERVFQIGKSIEEIIKKYKPTEFAIEKVFFTNNQKTVMAVAEVRGVCLYLAKKHNLNIFEYSPPSIKMAITGYGKATKEDISYMVYKIIKIPSKIKLIDDEIDAIAIGLTHSACTKLKL